MHSHHLALLLAFGLLAPDPAAAADCGSHDGNAGGVVKGTLTLDDQASTTRRDFHREGGTRTLQLVFKVAGCDVRVAPVVSADPLKDVDEEIPPESLGKPKVAALGSEIKVTYKVRAGSLDPGTYGSLVEVSDRTRLLTGRTPITISRSEPSILVPGIIGVVAGAIGFFVFYWSTYVAKQKLTVSRTVLLFGILFACGAGAFAAIVGWLDQDVWVWQDNWGGAVIAGFTQATAGVVVVMLGGVFTDERRPADADEVPWKEEHFPHAWDAGFWRKFFDACPPAFIKVAQIGEDDQLVGDAVQVAWNRPFDAFQGPEKAGDPESEEWRMIKGDHHRGDQLAIANRPSDQIESSDTYGINSRRQIVTFKQRINHRGATYIAGWYMPVELPPDLPDSGEVVVRELGRQPLFRIVPEQRPGEPTTKLSIGKSSLRAAKAD